MHAPVPKLPVRPPERLRARRALRSESARRAVTHIALPGYEIARAIPKPRETVTAFLRRTGWAVRDRKYGWGFRNGLPTILLVNGETVLRKRWRHTKIAANDNVQFVSRPLGGQSGSNTKQVVGLVALIAVAAFATFVTGGAAAGLLGEAFAAGSLGAYGLGAAIGIGGSLLINALTAPKAGATNDPAATTDQIYTASAQGNVAKLGQPLPIGYGREKVFPDFAATPWGEFVANDQYQNILLSVGMGRYDYEQMFIDDTPLWDPVNGVAPAFSSAQIAFYDPGEQIALFPVSVSSSAEVTGQQLPHGNATTPGAWLGGFVANPAGTVSSSIAIDFVFPAGCFTTDSSGNTTSISVGLRAEYRPVNDAGAPTADWSALFDVSRSYASRSPIRDSIKTDVDGGRYEVRFRRNDDVPDSSKGASDVIWAGLRSFLAGNNSFADVSTIAIRIKGTESTQGSFKFGVTRTRILPVWNSTSTTFIDQPTRNPAWAFLDGVINAQYGSGLAISKADFNSILNHAAGCDARGDAFDYTFTSAIAVPEALDKMLTVSRARHFWLGDTISVVRDEWRDVPSMLLTDREIVRDSTQIRWTMLGEEDPDAVILEYIDQDTWRPAQVQYPPDVAGLGGFHATNAEPKRIDGILNRDHAYREAAFYYLQSIYRRENVQIGTEYEGRAITFGSVIRVQSELPMAFGYGGAVTNLNGNSLTLNPAPSWSDAGSHFVRLRRPNGKWFGPIVVTRGAEDAIALLDANDLASVVASQGISLTGVLAREPGGEDPSFEFGTADNQSKLCVVLSGQPNGNQCTLNLVVDDERVHATDLGNPPILPTGQFPVDLSAPLIVGLTANFGQGVAEPKLSASWFPAAGAFYYVAEVSYDSTNWIQVYEGRDNQFNVVVTLAALTVRVQAVGKLHGPYSQLQLGAPTIEIASDTVSLQSLVEGIRYEVTGGIQEALDRIAEAEDGLDNFANEIARNRIDKTGLRGQVWDIREYLQDQTFDVRDELTNTIHVNKDTADASIADVRSVAVGTAASYANYVVTTNATLGSIQSQVTSTSAALSTLGGSFAVFQTSVTTQFGNVNASVASESSARSTADDALGTQITSVSASLGTTNANLATEVNARTSADTAIVTSVTNLASTVGTNTANIYQESQTRSSADSALAGTISSLNTTVGTNTAAIALEATTRSNSDNAISNTISLLTSRVNENNAAISSEATTRATGDSALSGQINSLTASVGSNTTAISDERLVRSNADSSLAGQINTLTTNVGTNTTAISDEQFARSTNDEALGGRINSLTTTVGTNTAAISAESFTRSTDDKALSTQINGVSTTVNGHTASLQLVASSVNGNSVMLGLIGTIDGVTGGLVLTGVGQNGTVSYNLYLRGNFIVDGTITASKYQAGSVDTITLAAQAVSAAKIKAGDITSDSGVIGNLSVKTLSIGDNAATVCDAASDAGPSSGNTANEQRCLLTTIIDTTGLIGKTLKLLIVGQYVITTYGGTGITLLFEIGKDGQGWIVSKELYSSSNTGTYRCPVTYVYTFTVTANSHTIYARYRINTGNNSSANDMVIGAITCKR